ncbi:ABC transporter substrate-binding protein [Sphingobium lignivorans]|uniref:Iron complex transport system substrate-binding protein n=1 Tax=Sphingobium lignivorans TaxID=2735886 RepID=A0ABR6NKM8_9SPHN|nr:ABC transporter substrate-binding protein [Sphingobium lignivorans]MBB5987053.1 iron complex transport system substrate-binding protein [Sphingobium lignivorans]
MRLGGLALLLALAGCGVAQRGPVPPADHAGAPPRVMSLNPCIDAILLAVADPGQILSISHYSHDPRATSAPLDVARRFPANGGTAEEVIAAGPDLVLLGSHVAPATQRAIADAGVRVETVGVPATIEESRAQVLQVARAIGHEARGRRLLDRIDTALAAARPAPGRSPVPALIRLGGGLVPGQGTLADELLARTGFRNMSHDYGLAMWDMLPLEPLIARPPHLLLTDGAGPGTREAMLARVPGLRVADFPSRLLQCAGPNLIEAAGTLATIRRGATGA